MLALFRQRSVSSESSPIQVAMRKLVDRHRALELPSECEVRKTDRFNICVPVAVAPYENGKLSHHSLKYVATKNLSACGMSFISTEPFNSFGYMGPTELMCGFWIEGPFFIRSAVQRSQSFGGDLHEVGVNFDKFVKPESLPAEIIDLVSRLLPAPGNL